MTKRKTAMKLLSAVGFNGKASGALPARLCRNFLADIKTRVRAAQLRAAVSVNRELILLYWDIGKTIVEAQKTKGYGKQVVERLADDLHKEFTVPEGKSSLNLWRIRAFYTAYRNQVRILSQAVTENPLQKLSQPVTESVAGPPEPMASCRGDTTLCIAPQTRIQCRAFLVCP